MSLLRTVGTKARPLVELATSKGPLTCSRSLAKRATLILQMAKCPRMLLNQSSHMYSTSAAVKKMEKEGISVDLNGERRYLNYVWLRDNCRCNKCYNHTTFQKIILPADISPDIQPAEVTIGEDSLTVVWPDAHESTYSFDWLKKHSNPGLEAKTVSQLYWNKEIIANNFAKGVNYEEFMSEDSGVKNLLSSMLRYGFGVVDGAPISIEGTQKVAERVSFIQSTLFGDMWSFTSDGARSDTAYTSIGLGAHNDSSYFSIPCGVQVFHKLEHDGEGGETLLVDGFHAVEKLRNNKPDSFNILCEHRVEHQYKEQMEDSHDVISLAPILQTHPVTGDLEWIRYNHYDRAPIRTVPLQQLGDYYEALRDLTELIEDPAGELWFPLQPGSVLFVDNWRVLHGRAAFTGKRRVCGCYLPRDDWISRARTQGLLY